MLAERNIFTMLIKQYIFLAVLTYVAINIFEYKAHGSATILSFKYLWISLGAPILYISTLGIVIGVMLLIVGSIYSLIRTKVRKKK